MKTTTALAIILGFAGLLLSGCETSGVASRIQEKSTVFAALTPEQQAKVKAGEIEAGFSTDMVYLALGQPSEVKTKETPDGQLTIWVYHRFVVPQKFSTVFSPNGGMTQPTAPLVANNAPRQAATSASTVNSMVNTDMGTSDVRTLYVMIYDNQVFEVGLAK